MTLREPNLSEKVIATDTLFPIVLFPFALARTSESDEY
jgi:hypothetical protein